MIWREEEIAKVVRCDLVSGRHRTDIESLLLVVVLTIVAEDEQKLSMENGHSGDLRKRISGYVSLQLVAEILTGRLFYIEIGQDATVRDLKKEIGNQENLPTDRLILMLNADGERYLLDKDEVSLKDCGVEDGSHIYIFFKPVIDDEATSSSSTYQDSSSPESPATPVTPPPPPSTSSDSQDE
ncbi:hypothetical protein DH2020_035292 [Rehmannia glutinosa]|uniref:Ubiquitin-like domain-containing protein n=1 Tax=Rehmannia glutinosa TaxID=99300 RepID=A0ABR0V9H6_REHGL